MKAKLIGWVPRPAEKRFRHDADLLWGDENEYETVSRKHVEIFPGAIEVLAREDGTYVVIPHGEPTRYYPDLETCCVSLRLRGYDTEEINKL